MTLDLGLTPQLRVMSTLDPSYAINLTNYCLYPRSRKKNLVSGEFVNCLSSRKKRGSVIHQSRSIRHLIWSSSTSLDALEDNCHVTGLSLMTTTDDDNIFVVSVIEFIFAHFSPPGDSSGQKHPSFPVKELRLLHCFGL